MTKKKSRVLALILALTLVTALFPMSVLAADDDLLSISISGISANAGAGSDDNWGDVVSETITLTTAQATAVDAADIVTMIEDTNDPVVGAVDEIQRFADAAAIAALDPGTTIGDLDGGGDDLTGTGPFTFAAGNQIVVKDLNGTYFLFTIAIYDPPAPPATGTPGSGTIGGSNTVDDVVLNVVLPTSLNFALNPLELGTNTAGSQVTTTNYIIVNKTGAPVDVSFAIEAVGKTGVVFAADTSNLAKDDTAVTDKEIYFAALSAATVTPGTLDFATAVDYPAVAASNAAFTYNFTPAAGADRLALLVPDLTDDFKAAGGIKFALGAATGDPLDTLAASNAGVASFQFYGELNTYADWEADDIAITGRYTLTATRTTTYANYLADVDPLTAGVQNAFVPSSLNMLKPAAVVSGYDFIFRSPGAQIWEGDRDDLVDKNTDTGVTLKILFVEKPTIEIVRNMVTGGEWGAAQYTYDPLTGIFEMITLPSVSNASIGIQTNLGLYNFQIKYTP